jgi:TolB-like protein
MSAADAASPRTPPPSVFLSYASEDRRAAQALRDALQSYGLEVWYDESGLDGGDAWDQKIRRQIRECDFFTPVISAQTDTRPEGYFRREWRLAVERTLDMADDHLFLLPVVIDDTTQARARVPEKFLTVQWTRVPGGQPTAALEALCRRLVAGQALGPEPSKPAADQPARARAQAPARAYPEFPHEEPGQRMRFWLRVGGWVLQSAWISFQRLPRWVRIIVYVWLFVVLLSRACTPSGRHSEATPPIPPAGPGSSGISPDAARKLEQISQSYQGSSNKEDIAKLGVQIAQAFSSEIGAELAAQKTPLLAIPFGAPSGDPSAQKLADSSFAQVYGRVAISRHGHVGLMNEPLSSLDTAAAVARGREHHSTYVLYGAVDNRSPGQSLTVQLVTVADGAVLWSESYPLAGADPARIAAAVDSKVTALEEE